MPSERNECEKPCKLPKTVLKEQTVNGSSTGINVMDLRDCQGKGKGTPGCRWRLVEVSRDREYYSGDVDCDGELVGLPPEYVSSYSYDGYMELQIEC